MSRLHKIAALLGEVTGLDATSVGPSALDRAVRDRMRAQGTPDPDSYQALLIAQAGELQELIETIVIPETWFFRDREAFAALTWLAAEHWMGHPEAKPRLLSLPCSTGEEPYSIAMTLLDCGMRPDAFEVEGIDISERAVAGAQRALYGRNSFRSRSLEFRDRYFHKGNHGYQLSESVQRCVSFRRGNLLAPDLLSTAAYDVIFCRNVLIYFDAESQQRAIGTLQGALKANGVLFVGPSESALLLSRQMSPLPVAHAFAFRPSESKTTSPPRHDSRRAKRRRMLSARTAERVDRGAPPPWAALQQRLIESPPKAGTPTRLVAPSTIVHSLALISELADRGNLKEAAERCDAYLATQEPTAAALYLKGLIRDASGAQEEAIANYRMALYLDPNHAEALAHLALALERRGDAVAAEQLRERARRRAKRDKR